MNDPTPLAITLHRESRVLEVSFDDGSRFELPCEYLRVYSPSAEVRGHGPGQETLQLDKEDVTITAIDPVGNYGIKPTFSDGHDTGIYTWKLLHDLGRHYTTLWQEYLGKVSAAGCSRKAGH
jgi:DUF971 family protein